MCGIAGVIRWGQASIKEEQLAMLLIGNEHRGNDASGLVIQQEDGTLEVFKKDVPAWTLTSSKDYKDFIREKLLPTSTCVLLHARGASQGNPRDNYNNHPMCAGKSAIIHNGVIRNDGTMFDTLKLERKAETDSDILRAIVDADGLTDVAIRKMSRLTGSGAIAAVHPDYPGKVMIVRSGNPLTLGSNEDFLFFSSEKGTLHKACRPFYQRKGIWFQSQKPNVDFSTMPQNTGWILGPLGVEQHTECKICLGDYAEPWRKTYENYAERQEKWDRQAQPAAKETKDSFCPKCKMTWQIPKHGIHGMYTCNKDEGGCGEALWMPPSEYGKKVN